MTKIARQIRIRGRVQGVGFRPFIDRLARQLALTGWVRNQGGEVVVHVEGDWEAFTAFLHALVDRPPSLARPASPVVLPADLQGFSSFRILPSLDEEASIHVPPDGSVCEECLAELWRPTDRRYRYPFINCTQCGPRYTIIECLPYDRPNTAMAGFPLCPSCRAEYEDPRDR
ncbi:MAG TPA: acylphosphatase, partial [Methylococcus sp.]|nr:acylphosphatase [Methylococcus sp.]